MSADTGSGGSKVGERLSERPAAEVVQYLYAPRMAEERDSSFWHMTATNRAHVVMLAQEGIVTPQAAAAILDALDDIAAQGPAGLELDPEREDLYFNYEHAVSGRVGPDTGGRMHTGRSRNDLGATLTRLRCRDVLLGLMDAAVELREALLARAGEHLETVMPGYTHLQPAQPITLGHYLTAVEEALGRDTERLAAALRHADLCPLGAAALAGTGFPINRDTTAELLGFSAVLPNTLDCVASRDYLLEALAAAAIMGVTLSRFAQDLYVWYSAEFGAVDFPDRAAGTSSIMPQKKNPILLEHIKGRTAHAPGAFVSAIAGIRNTNFTNVIDANREALRPAWGALEELRVSLALSVLVVRTLIVRDALLLDRCRTNFSTVTELADTLVRLWGISFRQAHEVVGGVVRRVMAGGGTAAAIDADLVREVSAEILGMRYDLDNAAVALALDPVNNVRARGHYGGPAPDQVSRMVTEGRARLDETRSLLDGVRRRMAGAEGALAVAAARIRAAD
ncbi:MAG: argininosuccinate lyase [Bacillota bacterium]|nr:argininosuccinate lyase [Bacillota bacterium]